ncbi:MAG: alpha/beta hydrolase [Alphaproteobacteria bacterium]|nr:alpha/beta hydrolase [Alphaproteobacteria bacterium]
METALGIAVTMIAVYALLVAAMYLFQRAVMYFPNRASPRLNFAGLDDMEEVRLDTADGLSLLSWYKPAATATATGGGATLVYFHGNAGNIGDRGTKVRPLLDAGHGVLLVGYRGYGGNPGRPHEAGFYQDGRAALAFLAGRGVADERIVLYGESLGGGVAVQMASERRLGAVVLEAPFTSAGDVGAAAYPILPVRLLIKDRFASVDKIAAIGAPLLIVHGEADRTVPTRLGRALLEAAQEPKQGVFLPGADHNDVFEHGGAAVVLDFLERTFRD